MSRTSQFDKRHESPNPRSSKYNELKEINTKTQETNVKNQVLKAISDLSSIRLSADFSAETLETRKQGNENSTEDSISRENILQKQG